MTNPSIAFFCMESRGHFNRLRPLISGLSERSITVHVFTHGRLRTDVERAGGRFVDLFEGCSLEEADPESLPFPCRSVSFAGFRAEEIQRGVSDTGTSLVIYDTFAVIGRAVASTLGLPYVNVCAGHNISPSNYLEVVRSYPRIKISERCREAVARLRDLHNMPDADPFSFLKTSSPFLNVYCEPPEFLRIAERKAFEPVAFFGSLASGEGWQERAEGRASLFGEGSLRKLKVYVSFGTVIWRFFPTEAWEAMRNLSQALGSREYVRAVISLGGQSSVDRVHELQRANVFVREYVDQCQILREADLFVTHHGLNSTHEAVFHRVPMISYPFFGDQPALAKRCQDLGLAIPLTDSPRSRLDADDVHATLELFHRREASMRMRLEVARRWEERVMEGREVVIDRLVTLLPAAGGSHEQSGPAPNPRREGPGTGR